MFDGFSEFVLALGFCFILFSVARILHSIAIFLEDNDKPGFLVKTFAFISYFLYFCVLPLTGFIYLIFHYPNSRSNKIAYEDGLKSSKALDDAKVRPSSVAGDCRCTLVPPKKSNWILRLFLCVLVVVALWASHYYAYNQGCDYAVESLAEECALYARRQYTAGYNKGYLDYQSGSGFTSGGGSSGSSSSSSSSGERSEFYDELYDYIDHMVWVTPYGTHYHKEECFQLSGHDSRPVSFEYAKSNDYSPCSSCYG